MTKAPEKDERQLLFATSNPGKLKEAQNIARHYGVKILSPETFGIGAVKVNENGRTFEENAIKKFGAYAVKMRSVDTPIVADDSGLVIDYLDGAPGVKSRRWRDGITEMSDQEMIDYCLEQLDGVPNKDRTVQLVTTLAYGLPTEKPRIVKSQLSGKILNKPDMSCYTKGYPFRALFYLPKYSMMLHELVSLPKSKRPKGFVSHREEAIRKVIMGLFSASSSRNSSRH